MTALQDLGIEIKGGWLYDSTTWIVLGGSIVLLFFIAVWLAYKQDKTSFS